jgi:phosphate transport system substrate-binding protein
MAAFRKTVLMLQPLWFQALVWRLALTSQQISVLWGPSHNNLAQTLNHLKAAGLEPDLLLIDLEIKNPYRICRWCRQHYPNLKLVLTGSRWKEIPTNIRHRAIFQGVNDVLPGFQAASLVSDVMAGMRRLLEILECPPPQEATLIPALLSLYQNLYLSPQDFDRPEQLNPNTEDFLDNPTAPQQKGEKPLDLIFSEGQRSPQTSATNPFFSSTASFGRLPLLALLIIFALLDVGSLWLMAPSQWNKNETQLVARGDNARKALPANTFQEVASVPSGVFNYGGSTTWAPIREFADARLQEEYPEFELRYVDSISSTPGSGTGIRMLLEGELDFAQSSRSLEQEEYDWARKQGFTLVQRPVAIDAIAVVVHPSLQLPGLTITQLQQIYLGQITNWSQVGGPDLAITPFSRRVEDGGTVKFFQEHVLENKPFSPKVQHIYSTTDGLHQLAHTTGGIYYASAAEVVLQCTIKPIPLGRAAGQFVSPYHEPLVPPERCPQQRNQINTKAFRNASYPITRNLFVIVKQDRDRAEEAGEAYVKLMLTDQGQQLIEQAGFVRLR